MKDALSASNTTVLASLAHWLKGSGGTAGFEILSPLAGALESAAKRGDLIESAALLEDLVRLEERLRPAESKDSVSCV